MTQDPLKEHREKMLAIQTERIVKEEEAARHPNQSQVFKEESQQRKSGRLSIRCRSLTKRIRELEQTIIQMEIRSKAKIEELRYRQEQLKNEFSEVKEELELVQLMPNVATQEKGERKGSSKQGR